MGGSQSHQVHPDGKNMKALVFTKYAKSMDKALTLIDTQPVPVQGKWEVLIQMRAAALNQGGMKALKPESMYTSIVGCDGAGTVLAVGDCVDDVKVGAEVFFTLFPTPSQGVIAEFVAVPADQIVLKPSNVSFKEAASFPMAGLTSMQAMVRGGVKEGDRVFIAGGAGGVGTFALQYAKNVLKAGTVATTASPSEKTELCKSLGADIVVNYKKDNFEEVLSNYDFAFDTTGESAKCAKILKKGGKVVTILGMPTVAELHRVGVQPNCVVRAFLNFNAQKEAIASAEAAGVEWSFMSLQPSKPDLQKLADSVAAGLVKPVLDNTWDLIDWKGAVKQSISGRAKGKCVIKISQE